MFDASQGSVRRHFLSSGNCRHANKVRSGSSSDNDPSVQFCVVSAQIFVFLKENLNVLVSACKQISVRARRRHLCAHNVLEKST